MTTFFTMRAECPGNIQLSDQPARQLESFPEVFPITLEADQHQTQPLGTVNQDPLESRPHKWSSAIT
jgi:hypothetical protein